MKVGSQNANILASYSRVSSTFKKENVLTKMSQSLNDFYNIFTLEKAIGNWHFYEIFSSSAIYIASFHFTIF